MPDKPPTGILLAAGASRRFGADKLIARLANGDRVVTAAARAMLAATPRLLAVVRSEDSGAAQALRGLGVPLLVAPEARRGMGASLAAAVREDPAAPGWLVGLGDMPYLNPHCVRRVAEALTSPAAIALPVHAGRRGHPVGFGNAYGDALCRLDGDRGARDILSRFAENVLSIECADDTIFTDIDHPSDLS
mgnify:CR=1 FL=1